MTARALKKVQYGYHGKNGGHSNYTERTSFVIYSKTNFFCTILHLKGMTSEQGHGYFTDVCNIATWCGFICLI